MFSMWKILRNLPKILTQLRKVEGYKTKSIKYIVFLYTTNEYVGTKMENYNVALTIIQ